MFTVDFLFNPQALEAHRNYLIEGLFKRLRNLSKGSFELSLGEKKHLIFFEISGDEINLFLENKADSNELVRPLLKLNIGALLLPEALTLDGKPVGYNPGVEKSDYLHTGSGGLENDEISMILGEIKKKGIINLILNSLENNPNNHSLN